MRISLDGRVNSLGGGGAKTYDFVIFCEKNPHEIKNIRPDREDRGIRHCFGQLFFLQNFQHIMK